MNRRVLSFDPGVTHLGWAVVESEGRLVGCGTEALATHGRGVAAEVLAYESARLVETLVCRYAPDVVVVERQMRDTMIMVAQSLCTASLCFGVPAAVAHPSTWYSRLGLRGLGDHAANKRRNVAFCCDTLRYSVPARDHNVCDAVLIGVAFCV